MILGAVEDAAMNVAHPVRISSWSPRFNGNTSLAMSHYSIRACPFSDKQS